MKSRKILALAVLIGTLLGLTPAWAAHYKVFVLTGQSNSLGTTNGSEADVSPGTDPADSRVKFFWANVADATTPIGDSGGVFKNLQAQQGGYYTGSATHWGPEINFGRTLVRAGVENIAIIKTSRGGGGNTNWSKSAGGHMYSQVVNTVTAAAQAMANNGDTFEIVGLLYLQGESDSASEANIADTRFQQLFDNLRTDLPNATNMKAVIGGIAAAGATRDVVRAKQQALGDSSPVIDYFSDLDLQSQVVSDGLHFNKAAKLRIGERFAQAFFANGVVARRYGKLVFIGDSITQGGNGDHPSYRYQVFKRLAEQGVPIDAATGYKFTGSQTGPYANSAVTTPNVNGQTFENVHEGHFGWRVPWANARLPLPSGRYDVNNIGQGTILNWTGTGPSPTTFQTVDAPTTKPYTKGTYTPDTVSIMIGINDLADNNNSASQVVADIGTLVDQLRASNPNVRIFINRLLYTNQTPAMKTAVDAVNGQLQALADGKNAASGSSPVWIIDASTGFDPVTQSYDGIHPNASGEAYVGDRIAAALGVIETPVYQAAPPPPHIEGDSASFTSRFEGNQIWDGSSMVNGWTQVNSLIRSLPAPTDLRLINSTPTGVARWIEGTNAGYSAISTGSWTAEIRVKCTASPNGFALWFGVGGSRIVLTIYDNGTKSLGPNGANVAQNNSDGNFHTFRIANDAPNAKYHVWRDGSRLTPLAGVPYDQAASPADNRLIIGDYTSGTFGDGFDITLDYVRFTSDALLPPGADADGNGLPDAWEYLYFGVISGTSPTADPDGDSYTNLQEFQNGTNPWVFDGPKMPVFVLAGGGNARGTAGPTVLHSPAPGTHPAEQSGGVWFYDGSGWTTLAARSDGTFGPELGFARMLWDAGYRGFGIVKSTVASGGNTLWDKASPSHPAYDALVAAATSAAATPPPGISAVDFKALLYVQGEENSSSEASAADTRFSALLTNLKTDLPSAANLVGIIGEIGGSGTNRDTTRNLLSALAGSRNDVGIAKATGITIQTVDGQGTHYDADGLFLLGARMASEVFDLNALGAQPLPAWASLYAWYVGDDGAAFDAAGPVNRWAAVQRGDATRDLSRHVAGLTYRRAVVAGNGQTRQVMRFDGTNDLWSNASNEFGTLSGPRTVAVLCQVTDPANGFLFDGATNAGRTRAEVRSNQWQVGVTGSTGPWDGPETNTVPRDIGKWQQHVFTYLPNGSGGTTITHWINGVLVATVSDSETTSLGGLIVGSNGGSPWMRLKADIAEIAVYGSVLGASDIAQLKSAWDARWGTPTAGATAASVTQTPRMIARFGRSELLGIALNSESAGNTLSQVRVQLAPGTRDAVSSVALVTSSGDTLDRVDAPASDLVIFSPSAPLVEGNNQLSVTVTPKRRAPLGTTLDGSIVDLTLSGSQSMLVVPTNADPAGVLTLGLVPSFTDVVWSGKQSIPNFRIPGIVCDSNGVLHAVFDCRYDGTAAGGSDLPSNIDVGYSRSTDGGATWTTLKKILDYDSTVANSSGNGVGDPCILFDASTNTIWVAALWSFGNHAYNGSGAGTDPTQTGQYVLTKSTDGGATWSAPINVTAAVKDNPNWHLIFQGPGHGLVMRDGTLVFPSQYRDETGTVRVCSVFSADHGATWQFGSGVPTASPQTNENTVCQLDNGSLLFSMRTPSGSNGQRAWIRYTPGGAVPMRNGTWGTLFRLPSVPDPVCQGSVIQWKSVFRGDPRELILFGNPASSSSRVNFTLRVSADAGNSWPVSRLLYAGSAAYSSICILPDKSIGVFFERDNYTKITFARVEEDWLIDPTKDTDGDGMPDAWELLNGLNPAVNDAGLDSDGDGVSNLNEYIAGTNPQDPSSVFRTAQLQPDGSLYWQSVPGRNYTVEQSSDLSTWTPVPGYESVPATGGTTGVNLPLDSAPRRFYRVRLAP